VSKKKVAIFISGGGSNMLQLLDSMKGTQAASPVLVVSNDPNAAGLASAAQRGVATSAVDHKPFGQDRAAFEAKISDLLAPYQPDIICLAGFMRILSTDFVAEWTGKILNIHPSLLPKYRGLHTHARAIKAGDAEAGCSVHQVTADLDDGPILGQAKLLIQPADTPESLAQRVLRLEHKLYPAVLARFVSDDLRPIFITG
jgi:phosphoribosylglycinamide formyltransferase 1